LRKIAGLIVNVVDIAGLTYRKIAALGYMLSIIILIRKILNDVRHNGPRGGGLHIQRKSQPHDRGLASLSSHN
jgi:hypothetical protein